MLLIPYPKDRTGFTVTGENVPIISCMGAGNKLDPTRFEVADIFETSVCPLAKVMRRELGAEGQEAKSCILKGESYKAIGGFSASCRENCICPPEQTENVPLRGKYREVLLLFFSGRLNSR